MGTNKQPPRDLATGVNDNATINTGGADARRRERISGDTDHDPDITGKNLDPKHDTLTYGNRDASGRIQGAPGRNTAADQGISAADAHGSRGDATRGPSAKVNDTPPRT